MRHLGFLLLVFALLGCDKRVAVKNTDGASTNIAPPTDTSLNQTNNNTNPQGRWISATSHVWATLDARTLFRSTASTVMLFNNVLEDPMVEYNKATGIFSPKKSGLYQVNARLTLPGPWTAGDYCKLFISKATLTLAVEQSTMPASQTQCAVSISSVVPIAQGEGIAVSGIIAGTEKYSNELGNNPYINLSIVRVAD